MLPNLCRSRRPFSIPWHRFFSSRCGWTKPKRSPRGGDDPVRPEMLADQPTRTRRRLDMAAKSNSRRSRGSGPKASTRSLREGPLLVLAGVHEHVHPRAEYHEAGPDWAARAGRIGDAHWSKINENIRISRRSGIACRNFVLQRSPTATTSEILGKKNEEILAAYTTPWKATLTTSGSGTGSGGRRRRSGLTPTNESKYFAETTEAFFGRNDFFPARGRIAYGRSPCMEAALLAKTHWASTPRPDKAHFFFREVAELRLRELLPSLLQRGRLGHASVVNIERPSCGAQCSPASPRPAWKVKAEALQHRRGRGRGGKMRVDGWSYERDPLMLAGEHRAGVSTRAPDRRKQPASSTPPLRMADSATASATPIVFRHPTATSPKGVGRRVPVGSSA